MAISYLVKINNTSLPGLKAYKVEANKLWTDAGRTMSGKLRATFVGIFPKIYLEFVHTTEEQMQVLAGLLDQPSFTVSWHDPATRTIKSATYYAGDYQMPMFSVSRGLYSEFSVSLIPFDKKS
jgi:hypothetical protein